MYYEDSEALNELKRVDHLLFVTLKYTRTVDIIKNILERLISAMDCEVNEIIDYYKANGKISNIMNAPLVKCKKLEVLFPKDKTVKDFVDFYHKLRKIILSDYKKKEEYRKNVALVTKESEVDIDKLKEFTEKTKNYIKYLRELIK